MTLVLRSEGLLKPHNTVEANRRNGVMHGVTKIKYKLCIDRLTAGTKNA